ncbi:tRNA lysidine(34) synthetase TilS [Candidatus Babeliales bacterium]|nr:tRNA lysidine(34) synthetase TilS [Candidatus Babeliales bacterium]
MDTQKIKETILILCEEVKKPKIVLGFSGGPDSTLLFHALKDLYKENEIDLICAHLNHGWREDSIKDEEFCRQLCNTYKVEFVSEHAKNLRPPKYNGSKEELGRKLRQTFLNEVLEKESAQFIALGHHADDQQETFFLRLIRGSSLSGLTCMKERNGAYIRPLLNTSKEEILNYLKINDLNYKTDSSNASDDFLRNRIRKNVIPALKKCDERFNKKFRDTLTHLKNEEKLLRNVTEETYQSVFNGAKGKVSKFIELSPSLQKSLIICWLKKEKVSFNPSNSYLDEITKFISSPRGGSHSLHKAWKVIKKQGLFWIKKIGPK